MSETENESFSLDDLKNMEGETRDGAKVKNQAPQPEEPEIEEEYQEEEGFNEDESDAEDVSNDTEEAEDEEEQQEQKKLYTQKQVDRKLEKRVKKERKQHAEKISSLQAKLEAQERELLALRGNYAEGNDEASENLSVADEVRKAIREERLQDNEERIKEQIKQTQEQLFENILEEGREIYSDFDEVVGNAKYTKAMADEADNQPNRSQILYYLGKHQDEVLKLAKKSPKEQARFVAQLAHKLAQTKPKRSSDAPPPAKSLQGSKSDKKVNESYIDKLMNMDIDDLLQKSREGSLY